MNKTEIFDKYAIEQGYDDFNHLILDDMFEGNLDNIMKTINTVTNLIQEELKKKIYNELNGVHFNNRTDFEDCRKEILNTEIL